MDEYITENVITIDRYREILAWNREDAEKANESWVEKDIEPNWKKRNPIALWQTIQNIKNCYQLYLEGDKRAVLHGLNLSLHNSLPIPEWIKNAYVSAYNGINHYKEKNWDAVFGKPYPKNTVIKAKKKMRDLCWKVHDRVSEIKNNNPDTPIDEYLFEQIGEEFDIKKTLASEYYYHIEKYLDTLIPKRALLKKTRRKKTPT